MQKNFENFSVEEALQLARSPAGQQLLSMLRNTDSNLLQQVSDKAGAGDYKEASRLLRSMLSSSEAQTLMKELEEMGDG